MPGVSCRACQSHSKRADPNTFIDPGRRRRGTSAKRRLALAEAALADLQRSLVAAQAEKHALELAAQQELQRRGHPQTVQAPQRSCYRREPPAWVFFRYVLVPIVG